MEKLILNKYRVRSRACGEAARSMREDHHLGSRGQCTTTLD
jgi:hypothetical protein